MIDYGEEKQTYGAPKIDVGPVAQVLTALYLGGAAAAFFAPFHTAFRRSCRAASS